MHGNNKTIISHFNQIRVVRVIIRMQKQCTSSIAIHPLTPTSEQINIEISIGIQNKELIIKYIQSIAKRTSCSSRNSFHYICQLNTPGSTITEIGLNYR